MSSIVDALLVQQPGLADDHGPRALTACRENILQHLDYLNGALALVLADAPLYGRMALSGNHRGAAEVMR